MTRGLALALTLLLGCTDTEPGPGVLPQATDAWAWAATPGDPIPGLSGDMLDAYVRGQEVMERTFRTDQGLGPTFNTDSCQGCHQVPAAGGSSPRYRDFWLVRRVRWDGALEDAGTNGEGPVRNLYSTPPLFHQAEPADTSVYARRSAPPAFGVGLFAFVSDAEILSREDPDDADGDGISGRANYEQGLVGRFGFKAQASRLESFNRGAMLNQMGLTSNPLLYTLPGEPNPGDGSLGLLDLVVGTAHAQVSAPGQPTTDDDGVADPELSDDDQLDLLIFSTFVGALAPSTALDAVDAEQTAGALLFDELGCAACHVPRLASTLGPVAAYSDLLLHDMGDDLDDGIAVGLAASVEWRTQPLWGLTWHGPYLHDGRAETVSQAIELHGGEGAASRDEWLALSAEEQAQVLAFLSLIGGQDPDHQVLATTAVPGIGEPGGPGRSLSTDEAEQFALGRQLFDRSRVADEGLGPRFNADSCRACHQDPVLGGAGGLDTNVLRLGARDEAGTWVGLEPHVLPRSVVDGELPLRLPDDTDYIEGRQPPTTLGLGLLQAVPEDEIRARHDPDDVDGDGISGRVRELSDGRVGRFGWKAQVPTLLDFVADALLNENGLTADPGLSAFTGIDDDEILDPELAEQEVVAISFYLAELGPPIRQGDHPEGQALFDEIGCAACHLPDLGGVPAWTDLLLHDVAPDPLVLVEQDDGVLPGEYRTPPLWGLRDTPPYLHDGSAPTVERAITEGHFGEAEDSRAAFDALSQDEQTALLAFIDTL